MPGNTSQYIDYKQVSKSISETAKRKKNAKINEYLLNTTKCAYCNTNLVFEKRKATYCNVSCSNKNRRHSEETKQLIRSSVNNFIEEHPDQFYKFLDHENQKNNKKFSSKNEKELFNIIKKDFQSFTSGGSFKLDEKTFLPLDMYSKDLKLIIEYDGIYHFKDIYGNLKQVQERDAKLNQWCVNNNWKIIRVNEKTYLLHKQKVLKEIFSMINNYNQLNSINLVYWEKEF